VGHLKGSDIIKIKDYKNLVFDVRMMNLYAWITISLTYVTPYRVDDKGFISFGYPFAFYIMHPLNESRIPLLGGSMDLLIFLIDLSIIYFAIKFLNMVFHYLISQGRIYYKKGDLK
jgi:hypothetical protein